MKKPCTEIIFILDRSGSMAGLEADTIGGFNSMLQKQKIEAGEAIISTVLFDNKVELLHDRVSIQEIQQITSNEYFVRGTTALLDAVGSTINKIGNAHKHTALDHRPDRVLVIITTDGMENASKEFSYQKIKNMIAHQKTKYHWEFIFLGANIDAVETAKRFGIEKNRATNYHADEAGTTLNFEVISETISDMRANFAIHDDWKTRIDTDFVARKK